ncbi:MAG TPA: hypothetical protein VK195_19560 [Burkholderiaceae bacterium]|nr:hypothetical protein [Burkholderiaceae bacterium]
MSDQSPPKEAQIRAILSYFFIGQDGWPDASQEIRNSTSFQDFFSVNEDDVYRYVTAHGWDGRVVRELPFRPHDPEGISWNWRFFFTREPDGSWTCGRRNDPERGADPISYWSFASREAMDRFIVHDLFLAQQSLWGPAKQLL